MAKIVKMGLTGGIASGKSEVGRLLLARGVPVVDMDLIGKNLLDSDPQVKEAISAAFGNDIFSNDKIDRQKLRSLVFSYPKNRKTLENIMHPRIRKEFERRAQEEETKGTKLIVCEAALLIESGYRNSLDRLTVVIAPEEIRMERLFKREPISREMAEQMFKSQTQDTERLQWADYAIENQSDLKTLAAKVDDLLAKWKQDGLL